MSNRRRHDGNRDAPPPSKCLGVFGLSLYTTERELEKEFRKYGKSINGMSKQLTVTDMGLSTKSTLY